mmetsp:Transcript_36496/g.117632  ORF Transcript_36496/g.117632 Transcript_36496/m.117632 type:complete len:358 (-) Transcript_36496:223-1296(-)
MEKCRMLSPAVAVGAVSVGAGGALADGDGARGRGGSGSCCPPPPVPLAAVAAASSLSVGAAAAPASFESVEATSANAPGAPAGASPSPAADEAQREASPSPQASLWPRRCTALCARLDAGVSSPNTSWLPRLADDANSAGSFSSAAASSPLCWSPAAASADAISATPSSIDVAASAAGPSLASCAKARGSSGARPAPAAPIESSGGMGPSSERAEAGGGVDGLTLPAAALSAHTRPLSSSPESLSALGDSSDAAPDGTEAAGSRVGPVRAAKRGWQVKQMSSISPGLNHRHTASSLASALTKTKPHSPQDHPSMYSPSEKSEISKPARGGAFGSGSAGAGACKLGEGAVSWAGDEEE